MNALAVEQFALLAGPVAGTEQGRLRVLLVVRADSEAEIRQRLADDPWTTSGQLEVTSIEPWNVIVGAQRLVSAQPAAVTAACCRPAGIPFGRHRALGGASRWRISASSAVRVSIGEWPLSSSIGSTPSSARDPPLPVRRDRVVVGANDVLPGCRR
jgi:uncharacterized protein YciI